MFSSTRSAAAVAVAAALTVGGAQLASAATSTSPAGRTVSARSAVTVWAAADDKAGGSLSNLTLRNIVHTTAGGSNLQIRISNSEGTAPITFSSAYVGRAVSSSSAAIVPGTNHRMTFGGSPSVTIPAGGVALSDPMHGSIPAETNLSVSLALSGDAAVITAHNRSMQATFKSGSGDHAAETGSTSFGTQSSAWYFLDSIVLQHGPTGGTMAALGDSITDGVGSTLSGNARWTDDLARRINRLPASRRMAIANEGISGNRLTSRGSTTGAAGLTRLSRDIMSQPGITSVFVFEGINDISGGTSAAMLISAYRQVAVQAHASGRCAYAATITPASLGGGSAKEEVRDEVNSYLRRSHDFDAVFDFDKVVRDPADPTVLAAADDSGDHIHLSDAGYSAVANSIDLTRLHC